MKHDQCIRCFSCPHEFFSREWVSGTGLAFQVTIKQGFPREVSMDRSKLVAIITGAISLFLGVVYLAIVQFLDSRAMVPAPIVEMLGWF
jgi:hypothetical protein